VSCVFRDHCEASVATRQEPHTLLTATRCVSCPVRSEADVHVTGHALDRVSERVPRRGVSTIKADVCEALRQGRVADVPPLPILDRPRPLPPRHVYAWPANRELLYVLVQGRRGGVVVKTVLSPHADQEQAA